MPFDVVLPVLGTCFVTAWVFITGMLIRDALDRSRQLRLATGQDTSKWYGS